MRCKYSDIGPISDQAIQFQCIHCFSNFLSTEKSESNKGSVQNANDDSDRIDDVEDISTSDNAPKKRRIVVHEKKHVCKHCGRKYFAENKLQQHIVEHGN